MSTPPYNPLPQSDPPKDASNRGPLLVGGAILAAAIIVAGAIFFSGNGDDPVVLSTDAPSPSMSEATPTPTPTATVDATPTPTPAPTTEAPATDPAEQPTETPPAVPSATPAPQPDPSGDGGASDETRAEAARLNGQTQQRLEVASPLWESNESRPYRWVVTETGEGMTSTFCVLGQAGEPALTTFDPDCDGGNEFADLVPPNIDDTYSRIREQLESYDPDAASPVFVDGRFGADGEIDYAFFGGGERDSLELDTQSFDWLD